MTLTTSSNSSIKEWNATYLWALKKYRGIMALLALLLFMAMPMIMIITLSNGDLNRTAAELTSGYSRFVQALVLWLVTPITLIFVVVISVLLFNYMHQKRSVDLFHALPIGRVPMLLGRYFAGLTTLILPILLNFAVVLIIGASYHVGMVKCAPMIISYMLWLMLMSTATLTFSMFMAVCTGTTLDMVLSILGVNAAYPFLIFFGGTFANSLLPGLNINPIQNLTVLSALSPFVAAFIPYPDNSSTGFNDVSVINEPSAIFLAWWIGFTLILLVGSILLYKKRKSECAENNFAFPLPKIAIRFMITAVVGLGLGLVLQMSTNNSASFFIGIITGSLAAHIVVEAIYSRGFMQLKKSFIYYGIFAAVFVLAYSVLATGCFGYDTRVPKAEDVASISIDSPSKSYIGDYTIYNENNRIIAEITPTLKEKENISKVIGLHQKFVTDNRKETYPYCVKKANTNNFIITYNLKNGKTMTRAYFGYSLDSYSEPPENENSDLINEIADLKEFRETSSLLFFADPEYIKSVDYNTKGGNEDVTFAPDLNTKKELLEALKQDYLDGKIIYGKDLDKDAIYLVIEYKDPIQLKDGKLKNLLGGYSDKVVLGANSYALSSSSGKTRELIEKLGWNK